MPIYEYRCRDCENVIEVIVGINGRQPRTCKECSGKLEKLISRTSFQLKGGGWFNEGYGSGSGSGGGAGTTAKASDTKKSESKSQSKGADKSAGKSSSQKSD